MEATKKPARHADLGTTGDRYGGLSLKAKDNAQIRLVEFVYRAAREPPETAAS